MFNRIHRLLNPLVDSNRLISIAKLFRFIKYNEKSILLEHLDESFKLSKNKKTLKSVVIYLTDGITNFEGKDIEAKAGDILIFPHEILHSSHSGQNKMVIRTDLVYEELLK